MNDFPLVYLASPFSHKDKLVEHARYLMVLSAWKWIIKNWSNVHVIPAIVLSYPTVEAGDIPGDWQFWQKFDRTLISKCSEFWVLCVSGYRESLGVAAELQIARSLGLKIKFLVPVLDGYDTRDEEPQ